MREKILNLADQYYEEILQFRRHLHKYPELSFQEFKTSEFIKKNLASAGIPYQGGFVKTGIVGRIEGKHPAKRIVVLRADMDALPIQEKNDIWYKSKNDGIMHACGHDIHMSCVMGAARILNKLKSQMEGTVLLVFQPGEELIPGGAIQMIREGAFTDSVPNAFFALHVEPDLPVGVLGFKEGKYMAANDEIYIQVIGAGGHAAIPGKIINPLLIASDVLLALNKFIKENSTGNLDNILSFGKMNADGATNVVPDSVRIEGTFRTLDEEWRQIARIEIKSVAENTARKMGGKCEVEIKPGYPVLINNPDLTGKAKARAGELIGIENIVDLDLRLTSEDFAYYSQNFPSCFFRLGVGISGKQPIARLHTSGFFAREESIKTGMATLSWLAWTYLMDKEG